MYVVCPCLSVPICTLCVDRHIAWMHRADSVHIRPFVDYIATLHTNRLFLIIPQALNWIYFELGLVSGRTFKASNLELWRQKFSSQSNRNAFACNIMNNFCIRTLNIICLFLVQLVSSGWTLLGISSLPGAVLCVTWVQVAVWFQGCSPTCWQAGGAPVQETPAFPQTPLPLTPPLRRSWRRITMGTQSTPESTSTSTDTLETPTVSSVMVPSHPSVFTKLSSVVLCLWIPVCFGTVSEKLYRPNQTDPPKETEDNTSYSESHAHQRGKQSAAKSRKVVL